MPTITQGALVIYPRACIYPEMWVAQAEGKGRRYLGRPDLVAEMGSVEQSCMSDTWPRRLSISHVVLTGLWLGVSARMRASRVFCISTYLAGQPGRGGILATHMQGR